MERKLPVATQRVLISYQFQVDLQLQVEADPAGVGSDPRRVQIDRRDVTATCDSQLLRDGHL